MKLMRERKYHTCMYDDFGKRCLKRATWFGKHAMTGKARFACDRHRLDIQNDCDRTYQIRGMTIEGDV